jgi:thioredoxin 1
MRNLNESELDQALAESKKLVIIDFWAAWCGPCKALSPTLDALAIENSNVVDLIKINVDENSSAAQKYKIRGIPTLVFVKDGKIVDTMVGNQSKEIIAERIKNLA